jgi:hypothetical protein
MNYLTGCALVNDVTSGNFKYNPSHSYAWNVSVASKQEPSNEKKVSAEDLKLSGNKRYYWGAPTDISPYNLSNLDLRTLIASYPAPSFQHYDWQTSGLIAWMPLELAADRETALRVYIDTLSKATKKAFSNVVIDSPDKILEKGYSSVISELIKGSHIGKTVWIHPSFTDEELGCVNEFSEKMHRPDCGFFLQQDGAMGIYEKPSFLAGDGNKKSYLFSGFMGGSVMDVEGYSRGDVISSPELARKELSILQKLSKNLPEWIYVYRAPDFKAGLPAILMNKGITYFYIE